MAVDPRAREIQARLNKKMGAGTVVLGSETQTYPRVPSGSLGLDVILGGGWPANQWHEIIGEASAGKTNVVYNTIAANQRRDPDWVAVFISAEQYVKEYAEMCGVDTTRMLVVDTNIMEEAYDATMDFMESRSVDCVAIDSLPMLVPTQEDDKNSGEMSVGRGALLTGQFFRKVGKATKRSMTDAERPVLGLMINQYREKIGVMHGDPRTTPGGKAKDFAFFTRVEIKRDDWLTHNGTKTGDRIGQVVRAKTIKNKSAPPQRDVLYDIYFDQGGPIDPGKIDYAKEVVTHAMLMGFIDRKGAWYEFGERRWQGKDAVVDSMREEVDLMAEVEAMVLRSVGGVAA